MGRNYYDILGVPKGTSDENAIKKAYKKAALKFHPDRPGGDKVKFQEVSEAFEVLNDPRKKKLYDQFGEAGLGAGAVPSEDGDCSDGGRHGGMGRNPFCDGSQTFSFRTGGGGGGNGGGTGCCKSEFHGSDPFSVFESIFGTMDVDQAMGGAGGGGGFGNFPMGGMSGMRTGGGGGMGGMSMPGMSMPGMSMGAASAGGAARRQAPPVEHHLNLSLEELYQGSSKRMRITKKTASGEAQVDKTISIKPGWKDGTRITFEKEGDEQPGMVPSDIVFVIKTKPHPVFKRNGHNLICTLDITLQQALTGFSLPVNTLDGRQVTVQEPGIAFSADESIVNGEGMPSQKDRRVRGNLIVRYNVIFPPPAQTEADKIRRQEAVSGM